MPEPANYDLQSKCLKFTARCFATQDCALGRSHGRNEVSARHDATEKVVGVSLHSTERHVSSRPHEGNVQPHMLQLGPLQLVHRAGISWTDRVGSDVATALHPIRNIRGTQPSCDLSW